MHIVDEEQVAALNIPLEQVIEGVVAAFQAAADDDLMGRPKSTIVMDDGAFFMSAVGAWKSENFGVFHDVVGPPPEQLPAGARNYRTYQLITEYASGLPLAFLDGTFTSNILPAAITLVGARAFARPDSKCVTLIGAGRQARINLDALRSRFAVTDVRIFTRTLPRAQKLAQDIRNSGIAATVTSDSETAVRAADIIVSTIPSSPTLEPFLDPEWVKAGAFVSCVDLARSWRLGFERFELKVADDSEQAAVQAREGRMQSYDFDFDLIEWISGKTGRSISQNDRVVMIHPGNIIGIAGVSRIILDGLKSKKWQISR